MVSEERFQDYNLYANDDINYEKIKNVHNGIIDNSIKSQNI